MPNASRTTQVRVLLFAQVRIAAGQGRLDLTLPHGSQSPTVGDALAALLLRHPGIEPHLPSCRVAVGLDYASFDQALQEGDEISLIPPVQGG